MRSRCITRRTGALFAVREKIWDVVKRKGDEWRIPTHEGGEVSENEVSELLRELRGPKTRDRAKSRLGRASPGATTLVPTLVTLLDDEDDDVRGAAVGALGAIGPLAKSAVPALLRIVNASSRWRSDAARSLGLMGAAASEAVPDLVRIVLDGDSGDSGDLAACGRWGSGKNGARRRCGPGFRSSLSRSRASKLNLLRPTRTSANGRCGQECDPCARRICRRICR